MLRNVSAPAACSSDGSSARSGRLFLSLSFMLLLPLATRHLKPGDDLADVVLRGVYPDRRGAQNDIHAGDILVISSKIVATAEGTMIDLRTMVPSAEAKNLSRTTGRSPEFCEAMLRELTRLHGKVIGAVPGAALTEVRPSGLTEGTILVANAGLDESNAANNCAIGWPVDPVASVGRLRRELEKRLSEKWKVESEKLKKKNFSLSTFHSTQVAIILTDSICTPRRTGVTAIALAVSGMDPLQSQKGKTDLFGKPLKITVEAVADQLATAANFLMGNAGQSVPAVIVRDHGLELSAWEGWVPGIEKERDLFRGTV